MGTAGLQLRSVTKVFGGTTVLHPLSIDIKPGEIVAITGPSGAGKTTTCRLITGLEIPDEGAILMDGSQFSALPTQARNVAHMFESYALYPHLNVAQNVAFPLTSPARRRRYTRADVEAKVVELLRMTQIDHLRHRLPGELSGGQKQRVALCRALAQDASVYIMDEPISHLDAKLRNELRGLIRRRQTKREAPTLWATPDAMEALSIADRVAVLIDGRVQQFGAPEEIYFKPATTAVARLVGDPAMNLLSGTLSAQDGGPRFNGPGVSLPLPAMLADRVKGAFGRPLVLGIRPNAMDVAIGEPGPGATDRQPPMQIPMQVYAWEPFGKYSIITAKVEDSLVRIKTSRLDRFAANQNINVTVDPSTLVLFDGESRQAI